MQQTCTLQELIKSSFWESLFPILYKVSIPWKFAGDLLLGLKFVKVEILSTSPIDFLYDKLRELSSKYLCLKGLRSLAWEQHALIFYILAFSQKLFQNKQMNNTKCNLGPVLN